MEQQLTFTVDSALLNELGERLVETVHVALLELVKNAYDADSTEVIVSFTETESGEFCVKVEDNGHGMTFQQVQRYWMRIATVNKVAEPVSEAFGRPKTGSKGIGRFSCRRLGTELELTTTAKISHGASPKFEKTRVIFNWKDFRPGTEVTQIRCPGEIDVLTEAHTGTTLVITGGDKWEWGIRGYGYLKRQLAVLVANRGVRREGFEEDPGFEILVEAPNQIEKPRDLREDLINAGWGTIRAYIQEDGRANCTLEAMDLGKRYIVGSKTYQYLKGVSLEVGIFVSDSDQIRNKSVLSKGSMSEILSNWGGVQVRHNGVRIYPYGDDDWLKIDADRARRRGTPSDELQAFAEKLGNVEPSRTLLSLLSHKNYLGTVSINSRHDAFQQKANREGFMETRAVRELQDFTRFCIDWATIYRDYWIRERKKSEAESSRKEFERTSGVEASRSKVIQAAATHIRNVLSQMVSAPEENERQATAHSIIPAIDAIISNDHSNESELRHLRLIASNSMLLLIFSHEVKSFLSDMDNTEGIVDRILDSAKGKQRDDFLKLQKQLSESKARFEQLLEMTALSSVDAKRAKPLRLSLRDRVERAVSCFGLVINSYDVLVDYADIAPNIMVGPIMEAELNAILLNALSNSLKSVIAAGENRAIRISAERIPGKTRILISDTGLGLDKSKFEEVFIPFIADPEGRLYPGLDDQLNQADKFIVGTGSGLGLSIVREIVSARNGSVKFIEPEMPWKAQLEVLLP